LMSEHYERIEELLDEYTQRFFKDFFATKPPIEHPVH
jgi:hypothetical protein